MDQQSQGQSLSAADLSRELAKYRQQATLDIARFKEAADVQRHLKTAVRSHPETWFLASLLVGGVLALVLSAITIDVSGDDDDDDDDRKKARKRKDKGKKSKKRTAAGSVVKLVIRASKPFLKAYALKKVTGLLKKAAD